jgi:MarR family transcriptional regulator for hemolysin
LPIEPQDERERLGRLIGETHRLWRTRLNELLRPLGLSQTRWMTLRILSRHPESMPQMELAGRLGVEPPTLVAILDGLTREGFIERRASTADRRMKQVHLTAKARGKLKQIDAIAARLRGDIMQELDDRAVQAAGKALSAIRERLVAPPKIKAAATESKPRADAVRKSARAKAG